MITHIIWKLQKECDRIIKIEKMEKLLMNKEFKEENMSILKKLTIKNLEFNKTRTIATSESCHYSCRAPPK